MPSTTTPLNILIIGAGLGGLSTALALGSDGHKCTIIDAAPSFGEAGAGIRIPPNSSRLLMRWGLDFEKIKKSKSERYHFLRWDDGNTLLEIPFVGKDYDAPYYLVHRADLHAALLEKVESMGVPVLPRKKVVEYDFDNKNVTCEDGTTYSADLLICADGIKSIARPLLTGKEDNPRDTGDVAYRILIPGEKLLADPELAELITKPCTTSWCGPDAHLVGYPIRDGELYNIVVCATNLSELPGEEWIVKGSNEELCARFASWDTKVQKLCKLSEGFLKWRLGDLQELTRWSNDAGTAVLLGDSCHPMLPYLAQGAAQAAEDAATLRACIRKISGQGITLKEALLQYEKLRKPRVTTVTKFTRTHQHILHIPDSSLQRRRDAAMAGGDHEDSPVFWGWRERRLWLFGCDAENLESVAKPLPGKGPGEGLAGEVVEEAEAEKGGNGGWVVRTVQEKVGEVVQGVKEVLGLNGGMAKEGPYSAA
ncbi:hypothetical protein YB2330_004465 [Saitoella coloradoensis]